jgi:hypothetical protein
VSKPGGKSGNQSRGNTVDAEPSEVETRLLTRVYDYATMRFRESQIAVTGWRLPRIPKTETITLARVKS